MSEAVPREEAETDRAAAAREAASIAALADRLREIHRARGELPAERALADELHVKRHRLRRALALLRERGELAPARPGRPQAEVGLSAEEIVRGANPVEVIEIRMLLEPGFARQAAFRASPREIAAIVQFATTREGEDPAATDLAFHRAVAAASRNRLAAEIYAILRQVGRDGRIAPVATAPRCPTAVAARDAEHRAVAEAIAARHPEEAEAAMRRHLASVHGKIIARLSPGLVA